MYKKVRVRVCVRARDRIQGLLCEGGKLIKTPISLGVYLTLLRKMVIKRSILQDGKRVQLYTICEK